jgi:aromatic ring-opening dioxygenase catalytic subunit (LigB family)
MDFPEPFQGGFDRLRDYLAGVLDRLPQRPSAVLLVTAHWEAPRVTLSTAAAPPMLYDYYGFPEHTYRLSYPAPGAPDLARQARDLLEAAGIACDEDDSRGFDHGVFVPMLVIDEEARIPVLMVSIERSFDPARHLAIGRALEPLRDQNVLIVGSGNSFHNLRAYGQPGPADAFDAWLQNAATDPDPERRAERLTAWASAPGARFSQPREDHLIPLMVAAGAAGADPGVVDFHDALFGKPATGFLYGA